MRKLRETLRAAGGRETHPPQGASEPLPDPLPALRAARRCVKKLLDSHVYLWIYIDALKIYEAARRCRPKIIPVHTNSTAFKGDRYNAVKTPDETWGGLVWFRGVSPRSPKKALPL